MKFVVCTGYKGGVGKSTTAINVATFLSEHGETLLVDGDPNRTALSWSDNGGLKYRVVDDRKAPMAIARQNWQWIVMDMPARPESNDLKELAEEADLLILPTIPDVVSLRPMMETVGDLQGHNYKALVTMVPPPPNRDGAEMKQSLREAGIPTFEATIRRSVGFSKAALAGVSIRDVSESRARLAWQDYRLLGNEILEAIDG